MPRLSRVTYVYGALAGAALVLVSVLAIRVGGLAPGGPGARADRSPGRALVGDLGCMSCHSIAGQGGTLAPPLGSELARKGEAWIREYLTSGRNIDVYPGHGHEAFERLDEARARRIARYLASLSVSGAYQGPGPPASE